MAATVLVAFIAACARREPAREPATAEGEASVTRTPTITPPPFPEVTDPARFTTVSTLIDDAIAADRMPGAVLVVGHGGTVVFHQAYGERKIDGEIGLDGVPAPAEPMTEDTVFDIASLTKCLATATAVMQLYEQGKVGVDEPVQAYLPDFNPDNDPQRAAVTVRMLLTQTSGEAVDIDLGDPWGLAKPDKAEGVRRALTAPLVSVPGEEFRYSDINYILLGALIEKLAGEDEDVYVQRAVFAPLGMTETRYLPVGKACGPHRVLGSAIAWASSAHGHGSSGCADGSWNTDLLARIAPTAWDEQSIEDPGQNPDFGRLLRGTVHDPTARRMGGVAGSAGVFSTARDVAVFAQALLDRLADRPSAFPLKLATLEQMTTPQQPGHSAGQVEAANAAAAAGGSNPVSPLLAPNYPAIAGQNLFGFGWDIDTPFSAPRGRVFPIGSFGNTGFTGTSVWMDPASNSYVVLLTNCIQVRGSTPISDIRGGAATLVGEALGV